MINIGITALERSMQTSHWDHRLGTVNANQSLGSPPWNGQCKPVIGITALERSMQTSGCLNRFADKGIIRTGLEHTCSFIEPTEELPLYVHIV
ncbi:hypothetical protein DPMN_188870 [Dreissena polymorpha]|uniref:Uncharacterized protein n=1 Tax=Dreissena polymorpha TaxID=45954 RepID=A0A9D4DRP9_DREPO|nr:hypothetical protein DPMN_188870 [Dreissena polymorpha]